MIQAEDVVLALSHSGETEEIAAIAPHIKRLGARLIAITGHPGSSLAKLSDVHVTARVALEACPLNLAPTASTTAALALGDALALVLLELRDFSAEDFARSHPGGNLGRRLLVHVRDVMRSNEQMPKVVSGASVTEALREISAKRMGMTAVVDAEGRAIGIFTDGDLRRVLDQGIDVRTKTVDDVMTVRPRSIDANRLASEVAHLMDTERINHLLVVDKEGRLIGAVGVHDLLESKVL
jgi:arabinose-5-phosphate isomerase